MEVLSFIVSDKIILEHFRSFIKSYNQLSFDCSDNDTEYYTNPRTGKNEIYFHFISNSVEEEFKYNYTKEEQEGIKKYFGDISLFIFEIQFKNEAIVNALLNGFNTFLRSKENNANTKVLLSYPNNSLIPLEKVSALLC